MKVTTETPKPEFTPRSITITFESQAELDALRAVFGHMPTMEAMTATFGVGCYFMEPAMDALIDLNASEEKLMQFNKDLKRALNR